MEVQLRLYTDDRSSYCYKNVNIEKNDANNIISGKNKLNWIEIGEDCNLIVDRKIFK